MRHTRRIERVCRDAKREREGEPTNAEPENATWKDTSPYEQAPKIEAACASTARNACLAAPFIGASDAQEIGARLGLDVDYVEVLRAALEEPNVLSICPMDERLGRRHAKPWR